VTVPAIDVLGRVVEEAGWKCSDDPTCPECKANEAALADLDALVQAAEGVMTQMDYETPHHTRLRAALARVLGQPPEETT
jgi:hypothetical protein